MFCDKRFLNSSQQSRDFLTQVLTPLPSTYSLYLYKYTPADLLAIANKFKNNDSSKIGKLQLKITFNLIKQSSAYDFYSG